MAFPVLGREGDILKNSVSYRSGEVGDEGDSDLIFGCLEVFR